MTSMRATPKTAHPGDTTNPLRHHTTITARH
jgi:hypothetical protein